MRVAHTGRVDGVLLGRAVHVYQGTYTDTTMHRKVLIQSLSNLTVTNLDMQEGTFAAPKDIAPGTVPLPWTSRIRWGAGSICR